MAGSSSYGDGQVMLYSLMIRLLTRMTRWWMVMEEVLQPSSWDDEAPLGYPLMKRWMVGAGEG